MESFLDRKINIISILRVFEYSNEFSIYYLNLDVEVNKIKKTRKFLLYLLFLNIINNIEFDMMDNLYNYDENYFWDSSDANLVIYVELFYTYYNKYLIYEKERAIKRS